MSSCVNQGRKPYLDVAKGLLIMMVVFHHQPDAVAAWGICDPVNEFLKGTDFWFTPYFMPAFYAISGMCSNFEKPFLNIAWKSFKSLMIPAFFLDFLCYRLNLIFIGPFDIVQLLMPGLRSFLQTGGAYWFLTSLFLARIIYWSVIKLVGNKWLQTVIIIAIMFLAICLYTLQIPNFWYYQHTMILLPFLHLGHFLKNIYIRQKKNGDFFGILSIIGIVFLYFWGYNVPSVTLVINVSYVDSMIYLLLSSGGYFFILSISRFIGDNNILMKLGQDSLIIYGLHVCIIRIFALYMTPLFGINNSLTIVVESFLFILTIVLCEVIVKLLNLQYIRWFIGKF